MAAAKIRSHRRGRGVEVRMRRRLWKTFILGYKIIAESHLHPARRL